jgi:TolB protein
MTGSVRVRIVSAIRVLLGALGLVLSAAWLTTAPQVTGVRDAAAALQPPAGRIIFGHAGDVWVAEGGSLTPLTQGGRYWGQADWSPDGSRVALIGWGQNATDLFVLDPIAEQWRQLTRGQQRRLADNDWVYYPRWSPDGEQIAYLSDRNSEYAMLWTVRPDGSGARQLMNVRSGLGALDSLSWSPDGSKIAVAGFRDRVGQIYIIDLAHPANPRPLTAEPGGAFDPAWSPDGEHIAYVAREGRSTVIRLIEAEGTGVGTTIVQGEFPRSPRWSPYGSDLAYVALAGSEFELFVAPIGLTPEGAHVAGRSTQLTRQFGVDATSAISWTW